MSLLNKIYFCISLLPLGLFVVLLSSPRTWQLGSAKPWYWDFKRELALSVYGGSAIMLVLGIFLFMQAFIHSKTKTGLVLTCLTLLAGFPIIYLVFFAIRGKF